jgi:hypothetical protein
MKFKITIRDTENGGVRVDADPGFDTLANIAREKTERLTPAAAYTLGALAYIKKKSIENLQEQMKEKFDNGKLPLYNTDTKLFN